MTKNAISKYLRGLVDDSGRNVEECARKLGIPSSTLRSHFKNGTMSADLLETFASMLGVTVDAIKAKGLRVVRMKRRTTSIPKLSDENLLPLIKAIAASGVESVSFSQFIRLRKLRSDVIDRDADPELVAQVLKHLSNDPSA